MFKDKPGCLILNYLDLTDLLKRSFAAYTENSDVNALRNG